MGMYWQEEKIKLDLIESQQTGQLTKFLESKLIELVNESYWKFCNYKEHSQDIIQDCVLKMLTVWQKCDLNKFEKTMPFFTSCIRQQINLSIRQVNGLSLRDDLNTQFISFDTIYKNDKD